jgi:CRISPR-associated protein Csb2
VVQRWRQALLSVSETLSEPLREILSGHTASGAPLQRPHLALFPLPRVGSLQGHGQIVALAAALPIHLSDEQRSQTLDLLSQVRELRLGPRGLWYLVRVCGSRAPATFRATTWTAHPSGARYWASITPVAFDRHPKGGDPSVYYWEVAATTSEACMAVGLPRPREVLATQVSAHLGVPPAHVFPKLRRQGASDRRPVHASLAFCERVRGLMLTEVRWERGFKTMVGWRRQWYRISTRRLKA